MKIIREYVRDNNRNKVGMLVACPIENKVYIGWSKCNKKDDFDKKMAYELALGRALEQYSNGYDRKLSNVPTEVHNQMLNSFISRCMKYYKDKLVISPCHIDYIYSYENEWIIGTINNKEDNYYLQMENEIWIL